MPSRASPTWQATGRVAPVFAAWSPSQPPNLSVTQASPATATEVMQLRSETNTHSHDPNRAVLPMTAGCRSCDKDVRRLAGPGCFLPPGCEVLQGCDERHPSREFEGVALSEHSYVELVVSENRCTAEKVPGWLIGTAWSGPLPHVAAFACCAGGSSDCRGTHERRPG
jgi:hypothetical protein